MGAWGVGILDDDFACDVYDDYMELHDKGLSQDNIRHTLETRYSDELVDDEDMSVFWLTIADAQWEYGSVDEDVLQKVAWIIHEGIDIQRWQDGDVETLEKRKASLLTFFKKISKLRTDFPERRKNKPIPAIFGAGDCLSVKLSDGDYGAVLVLVADNSSKKGGKNLVGLLRYKSRKKPTRAVFEKREWLLLNHHKWENEPDIHWCFSEDYEPSEVDIEKVVHIPINEADPIEVETLGGWNFPLQIEKQYRWESGERD